MKTNYVVLLLFFFSATVIAQYDYEPSLTNPFGLPNSDAPQQLLDFAPLIGECDCTSISRNSDKTWTEPVAMLWRFKYIMNGMAVQDETLHANGEHSGSIRQFIADSTRWYIHSYNSSTSATQLPVWQGTKNANGNIILNSDRKSPQGQDGDYRSTFSEINAEGFKWTGEWVSKDETIVYSTKKITCAKRKIFNEVAEKEKLVAVIQKFSKDFMNANYEGMLDAYTADGKMFPTDVDVIEGHQAITKRWLMNKDSKILYHEMVPVEVNFLGNHAYDYGYYKGKTQKPDGSIIDWKGKYVVVWKKIDGQWKMYIDIWNQMVD